MATTNERTQQWARLGAATRLRELDAERATILKEFPELKWARAGASFGGVRRKLTADARKKLSAGMRKYWARRKAAAAAKGGKG